MNVTKAAVFCEFAHIYQENFWCKTSFIKNCSVFSLEVMICGPCEFLQYCFSLLSLISKFLFSLLSLFFTLTIILKIHLLILNFRNMVLFQIFFAVDQNLLDLMHFALRILFIGSWGILDLAFPLFFISNC